MSVIQFVQQRLLWQHIKVRAEWIEACVSFLRNANPDKTLGNEEVADLVFEQLLHTDINGVAVPSLPDMPESKATLGDYYFVQVEEVRDVSKPAYSQLKKITGTENDNARVQADPKEPAIPWGTKLNRMLKLSLSDGANKVDAFEYDVIPSLSASIPPGSKLIISGPVECYRQLLFLKPRNVQLLGGCIHSLALKNTQQAVLNSALGNAANAEGHSPQVNTALTGYHAVNASHNSVSPQRASKNISPKRITSEPILIEDSLDGMDDELLGQLDLDEFAFPEDVDEELLREQLDFQANAQSEPVSLGCALRERDVKNVAVVKRCYISALTSKLKLNPDLTWKLSVQLSDDTDCLEADVDSDLIVSLMGVSGDDYRRLAKEQRDENLARFKEKLRDVEGVMHIKFFPNESQLPRVVLYENEIKSSG